MDHKVQHKLNTAKEFETEGKYLHAIQIYHSLISEYPDNVEAYINLADMYQVNGQTKSAEKILKSILSKQP
ncbi:MAG: tetratricopeptide repeat protein, partial [Ignavibacteriaceae bacterium]